MLPLDESKVDVAASKKSHAITKVDLSGFSSLPEEAYVSVATVAALHDCHTATVWRHVKQGLIPPPERIGGITRWRVSTLRGAR
jgi:predicted DNA-binding transcriptional regulator AlpA